MQATKWDEGSRLENRNPCVEKSVDQDMQALWQVYNEWHETQPLPLFANYH